MGKRVRTKSIQASDSAVRCATIYDTGNNLACRTPLSIIAAAVIYMLLYPVAVFNRVISISGVPNLTQDNILAALGTETGERFVVQDVDVKEIERNAMEKLEKAEWMATTRVSTISVHVNDEEGPAGFWDVAEKEVVGVKAVEVREAIR